MRRFIELFAGCGGMSLGLNSLGFELSFANELSPMAGETFAFNHLGVNLREKPAEANSVMWLTSKFKSRADGRRLQENPHEFPDWHPEVQSDLPKEGIAGSGQLIIGNIVSLNDYLEHALETTTTPPAALDVDLISGGPPCQSFSMAGLRQLDNHRNRLPWEFARAVKLVRPKVALLENVSGILRPFSQDGQEYVAWKEVAKAFVEIGYAPMCLHVNAKFVGVPQNRPRFLMFALRQDVAEALEFDVSQQSILEQALRSLRPDFDWTNFRYWDVANSRNQEFFTSGPFRHLMTNPSPQHFVSASKAIDDLSAKSSNSSSEYVETLNRDFPAPHRADNKLSNVAVRKHSFRVQQRFRLYQVLEELGERTLAREIATGLRTGYLDLVHALVQPLLTKDFLFEPNMELRKPVSPDEISQLIFTLATKKHSQRALVGNRPAPAALSIPDDCCHYSRHELRTLTVREVARVQSFPDWFEFRSKATTGGDRRRFEVPQYTQVGNAVPPILARQAGKVVLELLDIASSTDRATSADLPTVRVPA